MGTPTSRSPLLPVGLAMTLLALGFTVDDGGMHWLWTARPAVAVLLAAVGAVLVAVGVVQRIRVVRDTPPRH